MIDVCETFSLHSLYSPDSEVTQSIHANSEGTIHTFTQENQVKQQNFSKKVSLEVLWLQVGCAILYLDHGRTNFPKSTRQLKILLPEILYIKMNVCLYVCLYLTQIHISEPIGTKLCTHLPPSSGRDRRVCMCPHYFTFPTFSAYFVGSVCRLVLIRWLPAPRYTTTALYP